MIQYLSVGWVDGGKKKKQENEKVTKRFLCDIMSAFQWLFLLLLKSRNINSCSLEEAYSQNAVPLYVQIIEGRLSYPPQLCGGICFELYEFSPSNLKVFDLSSVKSIAQEWPGLEVLPQLKKK